MERSLAMRCAVSAGGGFLLALSLGLAAPVHAQESALVGHWEGAYGRLGSIQTVMLDLVLRDGKLEGTFDVPELAITADPIREIGGKFPVLTLRLTYGTFTMHVSAETGNMTGENKNWNPPLTLHLKRADKRPEIQFPRDDVRFRNGAVTLAGTLARPDSAGPHPAIVIVHGSGDQGRKSGFYAGWGDFFARQGLATLIYDKRGVGRSSGDFERASFDELAGDVVAAVGLLKGRPDIDPSRIGLFGISQGGWLAPLAASRTNDVKYLILDVGPAVTVEEQELDRVEYSLRADEFTDDDIREALAYTKQMFAAAYTGSGTSELLARSEEVRSRPWAETVGPVSSEADLEGWRRIRYDPAPVLKRTRIPILALFGELDVLVPPQENVERMRAYLNEAGNADVTIRVIPGVGHDMETFGTLKGGEWVWPEKYWVWPKRSPEFHAAILAWLTDHGMLEP